jgi:hypothetical protein
MLPLNIEQKYDFRLKISAWKELYKIIIRHPDIRVKHGSIELLLPLLSLFHADVFVYKMESYSKTMFGGKAL